MSIFTLQSNISSGKSTLLGEIEHLKFNKPHIILLEQVDEWSKLRDETGKDILSLFYEDKKKYGYMFQSFVLFSRISLMLDTIEKNPDKIIITERDQMTDLFIFASTLFEQKELSEIEWKIYNCWHDMVKRLFKIKIKGMIYLRTDPQICYERIKKRNRTGESNIPIDYLQTLHEKHEEWLTKGPIQRKDVSWYSLEATSTIPILTIDGNIDLYEREKRDEQKRKIVQFINYEMEN